jgi:rod shape-determining protein MreC
MKDFFASKNNKILTFTLVALIILAIFTAAGHNWLSTGFNALTVGLSSVTAAGSEQIHQKSYDELKKENEKLKREAADLRAKLVDYYDLKDENARLWKYYKIKKAHKDFELMPASVIRRDSADDFYSFTVDVGTASGVHAQDPVLTENGLVGFISSINGVTARVTTVLSPDLKAGARVKKTGDSGVVSGNTLYADDNLTTLTKIDANASVEKNDIIVTSGIGGVYPADLVIGKVSEIKYDEYDATKYAVIKPYEDIRNVTDVVIITDFKSKGEVAKKITEGD